MNGLGGEPEPKRPVDESEANVVIDAMQERKFSAGEYVINEGEKGDVLFVVNIG